MLSRIAFVFYLFSLYLSCQCADEEGWIRAGYWTPDIPISQMKLTLFTHLIYEDAHVNTSTFEVFIPQSDEAAVYSFPSEVREKNPSIKTLFSIWGKDSSSFRQMVSNDTSMESFIMSSINLATTYGFHGLDVYWDYPQADSDMNGLSFLLQKLRLKVDANAPELKLTATVPYSPYWPYNMSVYPVKEIARYLDWVHLKSYSYFVSTGTTRVTAAHSSLNDPSSTYSTDYGVHEWIKRGLSPNKLVLGLAFFGYAWNLSNPSNNAIGAPATGSAQTQHELGMMTYKEINAQIHLCGAAVLYNDTYKIKYCSCGSTWIGFDDADTVKIKVSYAKDNMSLRGYIASQVSYDDNWVLSLAAKGEDNQGSEGKDSTSHRKLYLLKSLLAPAIVSVFLLGLLLHFLKRRIHKLRGTAKSARDSLSKVNKEAAEHIQGDASYLQVFSFSDIQRATDRFSIENKIGEGGFGIVYMGILPDGEKIAVKKRSKGSKQGFVEFRNEITLTARLQHVNLVRLLGFSTDREEQMLVYEYMPNKSLNFYLFDPRMQHQLDWGQRICIIEGVTQGLLYLQEYSRTTIIHRDLKASNILLDNEMKPKISDFGMARPFKRDEYEGNASKLVGTYGYIPPEYVEKGLCTIKSDVYSFGVLLLQIISGKRISGIYGENNDLNLLEYAYVLWEEGKGMEFMDSSLDDTSSTCKLIRCLQIALLCVQKNAEDRPSMLEVYLILKNESNFISTPKQPAYSKVENEEAMKFIQHSEICSRNEMTMSPILCR